MAHLLIVDDDPLGARILTEYLAKSGFEVHVEADGEAALAHFQSQPPDAVLADVLLPKLSGLELARRIRGTEAGSHMPIFLMSGVYRSREMMDEAIKTFALDGYFVKPFQVKSLLEQLRKRLGEAH